MVLRRVNKVGNLTMGVVKLGSRLPTRVGWFTHTDPSVGLPYWARYQAPRLPNRAGTDRLPYPFGFGS